MAIPDSFVRSSPARYHACGSKFIIPHRSSLAPNLVHEGPHLSDQGVGEARSPTASPSPYVPLGLLSDASTWRLYNSDDDSGHHAGPIRRLTIGVCPGEAPQGQTQKRPLRRFIALRRVPQCRTHPAKRLRPWNKPVTARSEGFRGASVAAADEALTPEERLGFRIRASMEQLS